MCAGRQPASPRASKIERGESQRGICIEHTTHNETRVAASQRIKWNHRLADKLGEVIPANGHGAAVHAVEHIDRDVEADADDDIDDFINDDIEAQVGTGLNQGEYLGLEETLDIDDIVDNTDEEELNNTYDRYVGVELNLPDRRGEVVMAKVIKKKLLSLYVWIKLNAL